MKQRIFLIRREVKASNIKQAIKTKGRIYMIEEIPIDLEGENQKIGFKDKK